MRFIYFLSAFLIFLGVNFASAQYREPEPKTPTLSRPASSNQDDWYERFVFGGNGGLSFGSGYSYISVAPLMGYKITNELVGGAQVSYQRITYDNIASNTRLNAWGLAPFVRYYFIQNLFAHAEYEYLTYNVYYSNPNYPTQRRDYSSVFLGGGYRQPISGNVFLNFTVLYNILYSEGTYDQPYDSPFVIRAGITAGF